MLFERKGKIQKFILEKYKLFLAFRNENKQKLLLFTKTETETLFSGQKS